MRLLRWMMEAALTVILALAVTFVLLRVLPGNALRTSLRESGATAEEIAAREAALGLDAPVLQQFGDYLLATSRGDLGVSLTSGEAVTDVLIRQSVETLSLAGAGLICGLALGLGLGMLASAQHRMARLVSQGLTSILLAAPVFFIGTLILYGATILLPAANPFDSRSLVLPALAVGLGIAGSLSRVISASISDQENQPFVIAARAKGLTDGRIRRRHVMRAALPPIIGATGIVLAYLTAGTVVTETLFARPGLGRTLVDAVLRQDYPLVQGIVLWAVAMVILVHALSSWLIRAADPRVRSA